MSDESSASCRRRRRARTASHQPVALRICQAIARRSSRGSSFRFTPTNANKELKLKNRQLACEIARLKVQLRDCTNQLLEQKCERAQDWMEMGLLRQEIQAIRNNYESLSKQKKQMVSDFELQLSLIGKQLVESFRQKLDEVAMGNSDGRNQVYTNTVRTSEAVELKTPQRAPNRNNDACASVSPSSPLCKESEEQEAQHSLPARSTHSHQLSTSIPLRKQMKRRRLSSEFSNLICTREVSGEISENEEEKEEKTCSRVFTRSCRNNNEGKNNDKPTQLVAAIHTIKEDDLLTSVSDDDKTQQRSRRSNIKQVSYQEPKMGVKLRQGDPHTIPVPPDWNSCQASKSLSHLHKTKTKGSLKHQILGDCTNKM
ncbi:uncharacterized protein LOC134192589 isoform X2 [Corticium candelabrum]|uniref:uncharacterized protein LOC134192589 isoform X2 n=1 Tax=Corticium candelabrum TaxID=121492 RepID=UPI002E27737D|nr:uncharacterized protein LOC134192589 isoform X2 [Corticium candelabrum]